MAASRIRKPKADHLHDPQTLVGTLRRFGPQGPVYEVTGIAASHNGSSKVHVRVVESGEETDYPAKAAWSDPREA